MSRRIPARLEAEESLLGAMLVSLQAIEVARTLVRPEDFYTPAHGRLFEALTAVVDHGGKPDPGTVSEELERAGRPMDRAELLRLQSAVPASAHAEQYARSIVNAKAKRELVGAGSDITDLGYDESLTAADALARAAEILARADLPIGGTPSQSVTEFIDEGHEYDWAIEGLLEIPERLLIVAPEKYGKSTLQRQIAVCASQRLHPFRFYRIPPVNVALIDLENPRPLIGRKLNELLEKCAHTLGDQIEPDRLRIESRPEGLDITKRADEMWLSERIGANRKLWASKGWGNDPVIVCLGPIYKLLEDELDLRSVRQVQLALDRLRTRFSCALIMETHAPHESFAAKTPPHSLRPAGPRVWIRWPEFCRAIEANPQIPFTADFYDVQGARDERDWPRQLRRGGRWPWCDAAIEDPAGGEHPF